MSAIHNETLESLVISCLLQDSSTFETLEDAQVEKSTFSWKPFGLIYQTFRNIVDDDLFPDINSIAAELDKKNLLDAIIIPDTNLRGLDALEHLKNLNADIEKLPTYTKQLCDFRANRQLTSLTDKIKDAINAGQPIDKILAMIDTDTGRISSYIGASTRNISTSRDAVLSTIKNYENTISGELQYILTGIRAWDDFVGGLFARLYMIAAEQNEGKSTFVLNLLHNIAIFCDAIENFSPHKFMLFTFESSKEEIVNKLAQRMTGLPQIRIEKGELSDDEYLEYQKALEVIANSPIVFDDSSDMSLPILHTKMRKAVANGAEVIAIDQLEQISLGSSADAEQQEHIRLNYISYRIKAFSRELNVPVILVHQRKKVEEKNAKGEFQPRDPELNSLNQAGGKAPDAVMMIRTKRDPAVFWVKNRQGEKGSRKIGWRGSSLHFFDLPTKEEAEFLEEGVNT